MKSKLEQLEKSVREDVVQIKNSEDLENLRVKVLGRKGELTEILRGLSKLSIEEKKEIGRLANTNFK